MATSTMPTYTLEDIMRALREFADYVEDNEERIGGYNIDTDCLFWHIGCIEACLHRIAYRERKGE